MTCLSELRKAFERGDDTSRWRGVSGIGRDSCQHQPKRLRAHSVRECQRVSGSAKRARLFDAAVSQSVRECQRVPT